MSNSKAKLIHEWKHDANRFRLIAIAKFSPGYEDIYTIERCDQDALGNERWLSVDTWEPKKGIEASLKFISADTRDALVAGMKDALDRLAAATRVPTYEARTGCLMSEGNCKAADCRTHGPLRSEF